MSFSTEWENLYSSGRGGSAWPWSDMVSYVMRYAKPRKFPFRVLELGCGGGANIPLFLSLGMEYYTIEGSGSMVQKLKEKYSVIKNNLVVGDFTKSVPFHSAFDLIVDRASLTCNTTEAIKRSITLIESNLISKGLFIGIDWYSQEHSDFRKGVSGGDDYTRNDIPEGQFQGLGKVHFSDKKHICELFANFQIRTMEHKSLIKIIPGDDHVAASWNFLAQKLT